MVFWEYLGIYSELSSYQSRVRDGKSSMMNIVYSGFITDCGSKVWYIISPTSCHSKQDPVALHLAALECQQSGRRFIEAECQL